MIKNKKSTRANIIITLEKILIGQSLSTLLDNLLKSVENQDKAFTHELTLGTLRQWWALCRIGESLIKKNPTDKGVIVALNIGLYQILYMNTPDYAAINETLDALKELNKDYGVGLVNAILRKVAKNPTKFAKKVQKNHSLPNWLAQQLKIDWSDDYDMLGQVMRKSAPIFVRANTAIISHDDYVEKLAKNLNTSVDKIEQIRLDTEVDLFKVNTIQITRAIKMTGVQVEHLPGFDDGEVAIQDVHAQLSGAITSALVSSIANVQDEKKLNLLDACTAPAGKLTHWLAQLSDDVYRIKPNFSLTAIDNDENRLHRVYQNVDRLGFSCLLDKQLYIKVADAATYTNDVPFDIIMLDAPCSATGVIRRHPDISLLRTPDDVVNIVALQQQILDHLWTQVAKGGFLLYITCSILKAENETQMSNFLVRHSDATEIKLYGEWGIPQTVGRQLLPQMDGGDGFYYAVVQKN